MNDVNNTSSEFPPHRAAVIAAAIALFILVFQPFGVSVNNTFEAFIILGLAPLNFVVMLLMHKLALFAGIARAVINAAIITIANAAYLTIFDTTGSGLMTTIKVALISLLTLGAIMAWNQQRALKNEIINLKARSPAGQEPVILRGESDREILRLAPETLYFVKANGNYAEVYFRKTDGAESALLRATLANLAEQANGALIHCHRSYLVNLNSAQRIISAGGQMEIEFPDGLRAPVSRNYRQKIRAATTL